VVRDFPATHQSESAAFAIAELESEHGRSAEARAALQGYLARYPRGRFVREAALRLDQLSSRER
jgi:outer membrane protein assembly factor BamD (BamD/ComL family)